MALNETKYKWDPDEALERREKIEAEEAREKSLKEITKRKGMLPYSDELAQEICERISAGELLLNVCIDEHLPTLRRTNQWLREHPEFNMLYQSAINDRLNIFEEEVIKIADDMKHDFQNCD